MLDEHNVLIVHAPDDNQRLKFIKLEYKFADCKGPTCWKPAKVLKCADAPWPTDHPDCLVPRSTPDDPTTDGTLDYASPEGAVLPQCIYIAIHNTI